MQEGSGGWLCPIRGGGGVVRGKPLGFLSNETAVKGEVCTRWELIVRQLPSPSPHSAYLSYREAE